jgi:hypothetical protein
MKTLNYREILVSTVRNSAGIEEAMASFKVRTRPGGKEGAIAALKALSEDQGLGFCATVARDILKSYESPKALPTGFGGEKTEVPTGFGQTTTVSPSAALRQSLASPVVEPVVIREFSDNTGMYRIVKEVDGNVRLESLSDGHWGVLMSTKLYRRVQKLASLLAQVCKSNSKEFKQGSRFVRLSGLKNPRLDVVGDMHNGARRVWKAPKFLVSQKWVEFQTTRMERFVTVSECAASLK